MSLRIDINCDLGEGNGIEDKILPFISSASIACGGHAGDEMIMRTTIRLAKKYGVMIGAHPSYPDQKNFGRQKMDISDRTLAISIKEQIQTLQKVAAEEQYPIRHVKPHGALYNEAAIDPELAELIIEAIVELDTSMAVYGPPRSELEKQALLKGLDFLGEGFADRTYQEDGSLTPRTEPDALIKEESNCVNQVLQIVKKQQVLSVKGTLVEIPAKTICIHGDGPHALLFASAIHQSLQKENIIIAPLYASTK